MIIFDPNGNPMPLGQRLGGGGEAEIFELSEQSQFVAKIYRNPTRAREAKLQAMIASPPQDPTLHLGHPSFCWPRSLLFNNAGTCVGFSMHRVDLATHVQALKLYNPQDRQSVSPGITWKFLVRTASNIAAAAAAVHSQGHAIGDFNESNILVANSALVTLVDCDSMQIRDPIQGGFFRCPVGKPDFTPPELQGCEFANVDRDAAHDNFGLAVMIFLLLMEGIHPFNGVWNGSGNPPVLEDRIRGGYSPYAGQPAISWMPAAPPFELLPEHVRELFVRCFRDGHEDPSLRPAASEWKSALTRLEEELVECASSLRHVYSNHLAACPWCERMDLLGGIDPFPAKAQKIVPKPPPPPDTAQPVQDIRDQLKSESRWKRHSRIGMRIGVSFVLVIAVVLSWSMFHGYFTRLWASLNEVVSSALRPALSLSPLIICADVDEKGIPVGVSYSFSEDQVKSTGIIVYLTYTNAVPLKTTFQMRWSIDGKTYESKVNTFEHESDYLYMKLGTDLPAGSHQIEFLVDGTVQRTASIMIEPSTPRSSASTSPRRRSSRSASTAQGPRILMPPPSGTEPNQVQKSVSPTSGPGITVITYNAEHWHGPGSCTGQLKLTPENMVFTSVQHSLTVERSKIRVERDGILDANGNTWHFAISGEDFGQLMARWQGGELFPGLQQKVQAVAIQPQSPAVQSPVLSRTYAARHKHLLGSCSGDLTLTPTAIAFTSKEHSVSFNIDETQADRDGILDSEGKSWNFMIPGQDVESLIARWRRGELFPGVQLRPGSANKQPQPSGSERPELSRTFAARHKHLIGGCTGELKMSSTEIEFLSDQHYVKCRVAEVQIDGDGIRDRDGTMWRFEIAGENAAALLRSWKRGKTFP